MAGSSRLSFLALVLWVSLGSVQYGYHIAGFNGTQSALICPAPPTARQTNCLPISEAQYGVVVAAFTAGGLAGAMSAGKPIAARGRRAGAVYAAWLFGIGSFLLASASSLFPMVLGRILVGLGAGASTVNLPLYLNEIAPLALKARIGVLYQVGICFGICLAQLVSIPLSRVGASDWRYVPMLSVFLAAFQLLTSHWMIESPQWLAEKGLLPVTPVVERGEVFDVDEEAGDADPLLLPSASASGRESLSQTGLSSRDITGSSVLDPSSQTQLSVREVIGSTDPAVQHGIKVVCWLQVFQQVSGINAALYYSTAILSVILPDYAKYIALYVTMINLFSLVLPILLVERLGRKPLLLTSLFLMSTCSGLLGYAINKSMPKLAASAIMAFVASFSIGTGPIPFVLLAEVPPVQSRSASSTLGLSINWSLNILIGLFFLPVRNYLAAPDGTGQGNVFYIFLITSALAVVVLGRLL